MNARVFNQAYKSKDNSLSPSKGIGIIAIGNLKKFTTNCKMVKMLGYKE